MRYGIYGICHSDRIPYVCICTLNPPNDKMNACIKAISFPLRESVLLYERPCDNSNNKWVIEKLNTELIMKKNTMTPKMNKEFCIAFLIELVKTSKNVIDDLTL